MKNVNNPTSEMNGNCLLCDIIKTGWNNLLDQYFDRNIIDPVILFETESFVLITDIAPLVTGHCLIVAKEHVLSTADHDKNGIDDLYNTFEFLREIMFSAFCTYPIFFEHGSRGFRERAGCCIDHAHIHVVPIKIDISPLIQETFNFIQVPDVKGLKSVPKDSGYLFFQQQDGKAFYSSVSFAPTQYFRQVMSKYLERNLWNWKECLDAESESSKKIIVSTKNKLTLEIQKKGIDKLSDIPDSQKTNLPQDEIS